MNAKQILSLLNKIIPKKNIILFNSYPAYSDNSLALYKYIYDNRKDLLEKYELIWGQESEDKIPPYLSRYKIKTVDKKSIHGIITFLRAKYVFSTHGYFPDLKSGNGQVQVNLWHGCGYKAMTQADRHYLGDTMLAMSPLYQKIESEQFGMGENNIFITGYPRNDALFYVSNELIKLGVDKTKYQKILIWLPTYRKANAGHEGIDGQIDSFGISSLNKETLGLLERVLREKKYLLIIKPHPMETVDIFSRDKLTNIIITTNTNLELHNVELYGLLKETDCLLSDYSSVIVDYLLLDRPIAMILSDLEAYKNSRGFVFDKVEDYMPGPVISNFNELFSYFENFDKINSEWASKRKKIKSAFHSYEDGYSSKRVCNHYLGGIYENSNRK